MTGRIGLTGAFQVRKGLLSVPMVPSLRGRPLPLFTGIPGVTDVVTLGAAGARTVRIFFGLPLGLGARKLAVKFSL